MPRPNAIRDRVNAGAAQKMTPGQRYRIAALNVAQVDDPYNAGEKRWQVTIMTPEKLTYYVPSRTAAIIAEGSEEDRVDLIGALVEASEYYSTRLRRNILTCSFVDE